MGINLYCSDKDFGCSYSCWHNIRKELIKATFEYLEVHFAVTEYEEETHEHGSMRALKQYIEKIQNGSVIKESIFGNNKSNLFFIKPRAQKRYGAFSFYTLMSTKR
jgi:hypothetical protein